MDTFSSRRLTTLLFVVVFFAGVSLCPVAIAGGNYATYADAMSACQSWLPNFHATYSSINYGDPSCVPSASPYPANDIVVAASVTAAGAASGLVPFTSSHSPELFSYNGSPPPPDIQICQDNAPHAMRWVKGKILNGYSANMSVTDPSSGVTVNCKMDLEPAGPALTSDADGWDTLILLHPDAAGWGSVTPPGTGAMVDSSGSPAGDSNLPASASSVSTNQTAPQVCGGGSCYDPNSGQACALIGGKQACISVPQSAAASSAPGNCAAVGNGALCQGNPSPQPVKSVITDPATQIKSSDSYVFADPTSGQTFQDGVTVYTLPGTSAASGQKSGDVGPAPASTAPSNPSSYSGGTDCSTPPVCTGDAATCGAARTEWATVCQVHTDLAGTSSAPSPASLASGGSYDQSSVWVDNTSTGDAVADAANAGNYDQSGMGFSTTTCPMKDLTVPLGSASFVIPFSEGCVIGPWLRGIVIAMSLFAAAKITAGGNG